MKSEMSQAMEIVAPRILEEVAFLFSEPFDSAETPDEGWEAAGAELRWNGPSTGVMRFWVDPGLLPVLAANMLGIEEDDPICREKGFDALKETLNMIVGNCLTEAWGPGPVFHLEIPRVVGFAFSEAEHPEGIWLSIENRFAYLWCGA